MSHAADVIRDNYPATQAWAWWCGMFGGDFPTEFLRAWIAIESGGNACDGPTDLGELGLFQLTPENMAEVGVTADELRCTSGALTFGDKVTHMTASLRYVRACRDKADAWAPWATGVDYWRAVKMAHVAPARLKQHGPASSSWDDFAARCAAAGDTPAHWLENAAAVGDYGSPTWLLLADTLAPALLALVAGYALLRRAR